MKKILLITICFLSIAFPSVARHIKGGEIYYEYLGPGSTPNSDKYVITLRLFIVCTGLQRGQLEDSVYIGIFNNADNSTIAGSPFLFHIKSDQDIQLSKPNPCIQNPSPVCYRVRIFYETVELPKNPQGYTVVFQRCCRLDGLTNETPNLNVGASYTCAIHGTNTVGVNGINSGPQFLVKDTALICQNRPFQLSFGAIDPDRDSLSYEFVPAYTGGDGGANAFVRFPQSPDKILPVGYAAGFSGLQPLGPGVTVNPVTGLISGIAPSAGDYVVCVLLKEWRNGLNISRHRKDFIIHIDDRCDFAAANLHPGYVNCKGLSYTFKNEAPPSPLVHSYTWDFGVQGQTNDTSSAVSPSFTYPDSGTYLVKLIINKGESCSDSATTVMKIYPGFLPGFTISGSCILVPLQFTDTTKSRYGIVSGWRWTFGDETNPADTSDRQNPQWKYSTTGSKRVKFIVGNSKGCLDTVFRDVPVLDKPILNLPFRDTLICSIDTLQLHALGTGIFSWAPNSFIIHPNTDTPLVYPKHTTTYDVTLNQDGCVNTASIRVRVVDFVTLNAGNDTTVCLTDTAILNPSGDGLYFLWSPAATLDNPALKNPKAVPSAGTTLYSVTASIGKCNASSSVTVRTVPYPGAFAGNDTTICYADTARLYGSITGNRFTWSPVFELSNPDILDPLAFPLTSTTYTLMAYDNRGCPKPGISKIRITVQDKIHAFAGNDTAIVVGQPLQLYATGAPFFNWSPSRGLNQVNIRNPVAILDDTISYTLKAYDALGCFGLNTIHIKVFKTAPDIFVPNAFTPGKSTNAIFRPVTPGIASLDYFRVYNRWGQLVYSTSEIGKGWDGTLGGRPQPSGTYVWMVKGKDYTGRALFKKGTMILIR